MNTVPNTSRGQVTNTLPKTSRGGSFYTYKGPTYYEARLNCSEGYKLPTIKISKLVNGVWDPPSLECLPLSDLLELPKTYKGSTVQSTSQPPYHFNDEATLTCDDGYKLPFTHTSKVTVENGALKWKPSELSCNPVNCVPPPTIDHARFDPDKPIYQFADSIRYLCLPGFALQTYHHTKYYCGALSNWQPSIKPNNIQCLRDPHWCPELKPPQNGSLELSNGRNYESVASFACDKGYELTGQNRTCQEDQTWSGDEAYCEPIPPCPPMDRGSVRFHENDGFNFVVCNDGLIKVLCINGQWKYKHPYCDKKINTTGPTVTSPIVKKVNIPNPPTVQPPPIVKTVLKTNSFFNFIVWILFFVLSIIVIFLILK